MKTTPNYIKNLLMPSTRAPAGRRVWSIDLELVWLPFFTATNTMGDTAMPSDALGAPLRLAYDKDGSVKFSRSGKPITRVAKPISDSVSLVRENFVANLKQYAEGVIATHEAEYTEQVKLARQAGQPILNRQQGDVDKAVQLQIEEAMLQAEGDKEAETIIPDREAEAVTA